MDFNLDVFEVQDNAPVDVKIDFDGFGSVGFFGSHF